MDPLSPLGRNEDCWCGSGRKYKRCHGNHRPASQPGAPVPEDPEDGTYISPTSVLAHDAMSLPDGGAPLTMPAGRPTAKPIEYTSWDKELVAVAKTSDPPLDPVDLGRLRAEVMRQIAALPADESEPSDEVKRGLFYLAAESLRTVSALAAADPKPSILWNEELDPAAFLGRTLLLADYVAMPDAVFEALLRRGTNRSLRRAASRQFAIAELIEVGLVIPVPVGVAMAVNGAGAAALTALDLKDRWDCCRIW